VDFGEVPGGAGGGGMGVVSKPLMIDLFCGLGGWAEGGLAEGYEVIGFDIEAHDYGEGKRYPAQLVLQDVLTIHGRQFKDAALIVASPPCQEYSYMAMPWSRAKAIAADYRIGQRDTKKLTALFDACFRIQREAIEAAGHFIPLVVENVRGAQPWVGRARWNFGSFYLWGDVPAIMPITQTRRMKSKVSCVARRFDERVATTPEEAHALHYRMPNGIKNEGGGSWDRSSPSHTENHSWKTQMDGLKIESVDGYERSHPDAFGWKIPNTSSRSNARKAASAAIAKIPLALAQWIAKVYYPPNAELTGTAIGRKAPL